MRDQSTDLLQGTLDLLILKLLSRQSLHGWGLVEKLLTMSDGVFHTNQGSVYPALQRLKRRGLVTARWQTTEHNRRARYYAISRLGRKALVNEERTWALASGAVNRIIDLVNQGVEMEATA